MSFSIHSFLSLLLLIATYLVPFFNLGTSRLSASQWSAIHFLSEAEDSSASLDNKNLAAPVLLTLGRKIKLNQAQAKDLEYLPGIGAKTAEKIIAERQRLGAFKQLEDLMKIKGIKEKKFEKIKSFLEL